MIMAVELTLGAYPRVARDRPFGLALRLARLVGCKRLILIQASPCSY
jgi:hypothetical protein